MTVQIHENIVSNNEIKALLKWMSFKDDYIIPRKELWLKTGFNWHEDNWPKDWLINTLKKVNVDSYPKSIFFSVLNYNLDIHTDTEFGKRHDKHIVIPLEIQNKASTIIFNNKWYKESFKLNKENKHLVQNINNKPFDLEIYNKYLSHFEYDLLEGLSVKHFFNWEIGSICVFDSQYLHTNGTLHGRKKAINIWTIT